MSTAGTGLVCLLGADPATYRPHPVHAAADRTYRETNCYADVLIELLHARGDEPLAALGATVRLDFEGDQWTFFKPAPGDLEQLYGLDVHEMQPYRALPDQIAEQLAAGRTIIVELDAFHLPDTAATSYGAEHVKTSVIAEAIDRDAQMLRYFHNAGLYELGGEDYRGIFRLEGEIDPALLPPYTELVRFDAGPRLEGEALRCAARDLLRHHLARRPQTNPFERFGDALARDLPDLLAGDAANYHAYAFATVRMVGSGFELLAAQATWLLGESEAPEIVAAMDEIVDGTKLLSLKLARRRPFDPAPVIAGLAGAWERATGGLDAALA
ncbi:MAG TPA: DUF1839 family protein [Baekduia sp.]|uniref:DUF1839 family protein n=1 Tax=Baekduia sp. TaxID=2600305 RepID=UPI002C7A52A3|nr:DUF1839 family protein [Baekduia sp.]HMJ33058.1 DUF1839 family protein [Baekduia sp.]